VRSPDGNMLIKELKMEISTQQNLIVTGPNGAGKTSLLRAICGIWPFSSGRVRFTGAWSPSDLYFLPQRVYLTHGTMRDQLVYPLEAATVTDETIERLLKDVGLNLPGPYDTHLHARAWERLLSPGQRQRLAFARLLLCRPRIAILDEATSALDVETEASLYERCRELEITMVSVAHRMSLRRWHQRELRLSGEGVWECREVAGVGAGVGGE